MLSKYGRDIATSDPGGVVANRVHELPDNSTGARASHRAPAHSPETS